jgi:colicin import membrane protein
VPKKEVPKKEVPKKAEPLPPLDLSRQLKEQANRELENVQRDREKREALAQFKPAAPAAAVKGDPGYSDKVIGKIKPLIVLPPDIVGNPEAVFDLELLPTGDVTGVKLRTSSGNRAYDDAVDRAIRKASPLPRPDPPASPPRSLVLRFRPLER